MSLQSKPVLDVASADETLWLVKLPPPIAEQWQNKRYGDVLGSMQIGHDEQGRQQFMIKLPSDGQAVVTDYTLEYFSGLPNMYAFSKQEERFAIDGKVTKNCWLKPRGDERYRRLCRERLLQETKQERETRPLDNIAGNHVDSARSQTIRFVLPSVKRKGKEEGSPEEKGKRARNEERDVRNAVLSKFGEIPQWKLKDLVVTTQQSEGAIKEILNEYAIYHRKGPYKGYYQLKPEYQGGVSNPSAEAQAESK